MDACMCNPDSLAAYCECRPPRTEVALVQVFVAWFHRHKHRANTISACPLGFRVGPAGTPRLNGGHFPTNVDSNGLAIYQSWESSAYNVKQAARIEGHLTSLNLLIQNQTPFFLVFIACTFHPQIIQERKGLALYFRSVTTSPDLIVMCVLLDALYYFGQIWATFYVATTVCHYLFFSIPFATAPKVFLVFQCNYPCSQWPKCRGGGGTRGSS
jgi:hypothetical protein